jgi:hypothetical protein
MGDRDRTSARSLTHTTQSGAVRGWLAASLLTLLITVVPAFLFGLPASAAVTSVTLSQCTNGDSSPLQLEQCEGSSGGGGVSALNGAVNSAGYKNWVSGDANGTKAHWHEGDFIPYRTEITAGAGTYTLEVQYANVKANAHAIDYLGSYDASETTSTACTQPAVDTYAAGCAPPAVFHANYNNPCIDLTAGAGMAASNCSSGPGAAPIVRNNPPTSGTVPPADIAGAETCGGSQFSGGTIAGGTFAQTQGQFQIFGPANSNVGAVTYPAGLQNVPSGTGACTTDVAVTFTIGGTGTQTAVLAWGGHIASAADWGPAHSADEINGSSYHMSLVSITQGSTVTGLGGQDRGLQTSAVVFTPSVTTQLSATSVSTGGTVHDTATVSNASPLAAGSVTFTVYTDVSCTAAATTGGSGEISAQPGQVSATNNAGTLTAVSPNVTFNQPSPSGTYYWQAAYSGSGNT